MAVTARGKGPTTVMISEGERKNFDYSWHRRESEKGNRDFI